jgi:multidrug resistance efflux pump
VLVALKYWDYLANPWTRDGQVRANVIQVASRVSGPIVELPIVDNQFVSAGDLLFKIDPRTYQAEYDRAVAALDETLDQLDALDGQVKAAEAQVAQSESLVSQAEAQVRSAEATLTEATVNLERFKALLAEGNIAQARMDAQQREYDVDQAAKDRADGALIQARAALLQAEADRRAAVANRGATGEDNAQLRAARAQVETARLNLEFTEQRASVDGYVTNLQLRLGSIAATNQPALALVDSNSFWVDAYFRETFVGRIESGDAAYITLMSYPDTVIEGRVDSLAWGIAQSDGSTSQDLLPQVSPTFEWIRLAQRIPVRIVLNELPEGVALRVGTTASVMVATDGTDGETPPPAPSLLQ